MELDATPPEKTTGKPGYTFKAFWVAFKTAFATQPDWDYFGICLHEQYFYPDYFGYQPEYERKILKMCEIMTNAGYTFINGDEILD